MLNATLVRCLADDQPRFDNGKDKIPYPRLMEVEAPYDLLDSDTVTHTTSTFTIKLFIFAYLRAKSSMEARLQKPKHWTLALQRFSVGAHIYPSIEFLFLFPCAGDDLPPHIVAG